MNKQSRFSAVPVGEKFEYNGETYIRFSYFRGKKSDGSFKHFKKHQLVEWINPYPNALEESC